MSKILHPGINPEDYRNVGENLSGVAGWEARILAGNSLTEGTKRGHMDQVGYVLVPLQGPMQVIPLARGDEHHMGFDLLHDMRRKRKWKVEGEFQPIFAGGNGVYLYQDSEIKDALIAIKRWRQAKGPNLMILSGDFARSWAMTFDDFIARKGKVEVLPNTLLPIGERFALALEQISLGISRSRDPQYPSKLVPTDKQGLRLIRDGVRSLMAVLEQTPSLLFSATDRMEDMKKLDEAGRLANIRTRFDDALTREDLHVIEDLVFTHNGIKNSVHMEIRQDIGNTWSTLGRLFGDLSFANDRLGRISPSPYPEAEENLEMEADVEGGPSFRP